jgi:HK97 family phage prohead protease
VNVEYITVPLEVKSLESGQFEGYGSTFGNIDLGGDVVVKGAFEDSLERYRKEGEWPQMYWMHKPDQVPGVWLDMREDAKGLRVKGEPIETSIGKDLKVMLNRKAVRAMSIGFSLDDRGDYEFRDGLRFLKRINLWEVSPVTAPMNPKAKILAVKALLIKQGVGMSDFKRELESWFREKGLSKSQAVAFASRALAEDFDLVAGATLAADEIDDKSGAMPDESRRDAGVNDEAAKAALALLDKIRAASLTDVKFT